jgi:hypothetical protein
MILDALTRAEHERQLEKQPDLKFVTPVKPQKKTPNKLIFWVGLAVLVNALILFILVRALTGNADQAAPTDFGGIEEKQPAVNTLVQQESIQSTQQQSSQILNSQAIETAPLAQESISMLNNGQQEDQTTHINEARPLAMEANSTQLPAIDRPLFYESKQSVSKPKVAMTDPPAKISNATKGKVSFSSTELNVDDALPVINKPKLLIDGVSNGRDSSNVLNVRDLPESSRANLNQYEVNVHVFDDDPIRRFVLINMDKYKEGDRIINNGPLVEEITATGVVVDYGNGRALLPPK